jgi:hypothetical protein
MSWQPALDPKPGDTSGPVRQPEIAHHCTAHSEEEVEHLKGHGASNVVLGEDEMAKAILALVPA